jgi:hypothetical protein
MPEFRPRIESNEADGMRNRTKIAIFPARARAGALALLVALWPGASGAARADSFFLRSGEPIDGSIVQATRNTLIIRRGIGGMHQTSIRDIEEVRIDLAQGEQISSQLLGWAEGPDPLAGGSGRRDSRASLQDSGSTMRGKRHDASHRVQAGWQHAGSADPDARRMAASLHRRRSRSRTARWSSRSRAGAFAASLGAAS